MQNAKQTIVWTGNIATPCRPEFPPFIAEDAPAQTICPCCKSAISVKIPIVDLNTNAVSWRGKSTQIRRFSAKLLSLLLRRHPGMVSYEQIIIHLWGDDEGEDAANTVKVHVCALRKALKPLGIGITNIWGSGYKLELAQ